MVTEFAFSEPRIRALKPLASDTSSARQYHKDTETPGLQVAVFPTGTKVYYYVRRIEGKPTRVKLGTTEQLSVAQARKAATKKAGEIADGKNPQAERRRKREESTLAELWQSYLQLHAKPRKKSWKDDERMYGKYLGDFHGKRLSAITQTAVAKWHGTVAKNHGPYQANRVKALLATMFAKASAAVGFTGPNPCVGVANFPERSRKRFLLPAEMAAFFTALATEDPYWQAFFLLCLFTGSRRGNVASMAWAELDLTNSVWHIPASKTKNKRPTSIAICAPAMAILKARYEQRNGSQWVFPAFKGESHLADPRKSWNRILTAMKTCPKCNEVIGEGELIDKHAWKKADRKYRCPKCKAELPETDPPDLRMHDLRRTQGSWQAAMGISLAIIGKSLGHADLKSTQVYSRLQLDPVRDAVSRASDSMIQAAGFQIGSGGMERLTVDVASTEENSK